MLNLTKYDLNGKQIETLEVDDALVKSVANTQMIKDYLVAIRNNQRQWSASTKDRSEVKCTKKKPHPQKGTGHARQGSLVAPQFRGGGIVFGPKPKYDQHVKINKKEKRAVISYLLSEKIKEGKLALLNAEGMEKPKTRILANFLKTLSLVGQSVLFLDAAQTNADLWSIFTKSLRNIPKMSFKRMNHINGYDLALHKHVFILDSAFDELTNLLQSSYRKEA